MAGHFNQAYGETFPLPGELLSAAPIVPGTDGRKMSKSYGNTIDLFAEGKALQNQVMGIVTDSTPLEEPKKPETCNVFALYKLFATAEEQAKLATLYEYPTLDAESRKGRPFGYGDAKKLLLAKVDSHFQAARERRKQLAANPKIIEEVLRDGAMRARTEARNTMALVRSAVGISPSPAAL
jgi:tryptophanyl-tRNA synthetase